MYIYIYIERERDRRERERAIEAARGLVPQEHEGRDHRLGRAAPGDGGLRARRSEPVRDFFIAKSIRRLQFPGPPPSC